MKQLIIFILATIFSTQLIAQPDTTKISVKEKNLVTVIDSNDGTHVKVGNNKGIEVITDDWGDTTKIRIGSRTFKVVEDWHGTHVKMGRDYYSSKYKGHFNAHWAGIEWGMNMYGKTNYSLYNGNEFMELNPAKSITVNINFAEWAFKNDAKTAAIVTGAGFSFMDLAFDDPSISITKTDGMIQPYTHSIPNPKKSKLSVSYFTIPLMLEVKTPFRLNRNNLYIAGGLIGGMHLGSHTKFKSKKDKAKEKGNFYVNQFKYDLTARIGFGDFCIFANYSMVPLFKNNKGPELYPFTLGFSFPNL